MSIKLILTVILIAIVMTWPNRFANWVHACFMRHQVTLLPHAHIRKHKVIFKEEQSSVSSWINQAV